MIPDWSEEIVRAVSAFLRTELQAPVARLSAMIEILELRRRSRRQRGNARGMVLHRVGNPSDRHICVPDCLDFLEAVFLCQAIESREDFVQKIKCPRRLEPGR